MKERNHENAVNYRHPFGVTTRRKTRGHRTLDYNGRSPETAAMKAHLRASTYRDRKAGETPATTSPSGFGYRSTSRARALFNLGREYDIQARDNFAKEAVFFGIIIFAALAWPLVQSLRALTGSH